VVPLALLPELFIPPSGFRVTPVLAHWRDPVAVQPVDPAETATVVRVPVTELADPGHRFLVRHPSGWVGPAFEVAGMVVWGFTGGLVDTLLRMGGWEQPWGDGPARDLDGAWLTARQRRKSTRLTEFRRVSAVPSAGRGVGAMSWVDVFVLLLAVLAGVSGWRHGMAVALAVLRRSARWRDHRGPLAPVLAQHVESPTARVMVSIGVVVLLVALGETTGVFFGRRIRDRITGEHSLRLDSTLGAILQGLTVVLAAWLVALPLASASFPGLAAGIKGSKVLEAVDSVVGSVLPSAPPAALRAACAARLVRFPRRAHPVRTDSDHRGRPAQPGAADERGGADGRGQRAEDPRQGHPVLAGAGGLRLRGRAGPRGDERARGGRYPPR